ncbi:MAG: DUF4433 domain-containing protein [Sedimentisphaerales bacterium]|nr:DUF4433 domain-containing protein [Sedimentisphaerales bacterium]
MVETPENPKIFHITHISNLDSIVKDKFLWSDKKRIDLGRECEIVGMTEIKRRRLEVHEVNCHSNTKVGEYVPFNFCPRSVMLYILFKGNHPDITYRQGQEQIVHLQADLKTSVVWADNNDVRWAFSDRNAGMYFAQFYKDIANLDKINWSAVRATVFRDMLVKEEKQAEFLVHESFPWQLIEKIGVYNNRSKVQVIAMLGNSISPRISVERQWYY